MRKFYLTLYIVFAFCSAKAQTWNWATDVGRLYGTERPLVKTNDAGDIFTAGAFTGNATLGDTTWFQDTTDFNNRGIYVARLTADGQLGGGRGGGGGGATRGGN